MFISEILTSNITYSPALYKDMKKIMILFLLVFTTILISFSQNRIIIRYVDTALQTPIRIQGYLFSTWKFEEFEIKDSLSYVFVKQKTDSLEFCLDDSTCHFPDVRQQIIVIYGEKYDILSSDGSFAMEKNGKSVLFDNTLQTAINQVIEKHEQKLPPSKCIKKLEVAMPN
jgi:hypothetical protein